MNSEGRPADSTRGRGCAGRCRRSSSGPDTFPNETPATALRLTSKQSHTAARPRPVPAVPDDIPPRDEPRPGRPRGRGTPANPAAPGGRHARGPWPRLVPRFRRATSVVLLNASRPYPTGAARVAAERAAAEPTEPAGCRLPRRRFVLTQSSGMEAHVIRTRCRRTGATTAWTIPCRLNRPMRHRSST